MTEPDLASARVMQWLASDYSHEARLFAHRARNADGPVARSRYTAQAITLQQEAAVRYAVARKLLGVEDV